MKRINIAIAVLFLLLSCQRKQDIASVEIQKIETKDSTSGTTSQERPIFAAKDASVLLQGTAAQKAFLLLKSLHPTIATLSLDDLISPQELAEVKNFTDQLMLQHHAVTNTEKYYAIFKWVVENIQYDHSDNTAYATFKNRKAVCQGYANLFKVMCQTQNIPIIVANGMLVSYFGDGIGGGHAWNYAYVEGKWRVADPTNSGYIAREYAIEDVEAYQEYLQPSILNISFFEDDYFEYAFEDEQLTITKVKKIKDGTTMLTVPYSAGGYVITAFNPSVLPSSVTSVCIGDNIVSLGRSDNRRLTDLMHKLKNIYVSPMNAQFESVNDLVYDKLTEELVLVPLSLEKITLKAQKIIAKNTLLQHTKVKELVFSEGTEQIEDFAVEGCPALQRILIPKTVKFVAQKAFEKCHPMLKIIYY